jgi:hypothetical protein
MQSDPMWSCAMAVNVYLVFFRRYDAHRLKRLYWIYGVICYGLPFIPAMFCLFYKTKRQGKMYGNATVSASSLKVYVSNPHSSGVGSTTIGPRSGSTPIMPLSG